jgi:hypothetical protein
MGISSPSLALFARATPFSHLGAKLGDLTICQLLDDSPKLTVGLQAATDRINVLGANM